MEAFGDLEREFVERGEKSKKPSEKRRNDDGEKGVPDEEVDDAGFGRAAFLPSDSRMEEVGEDGGDGGGNEGGEPEEVTVVDDDEGEKSVEEIVENGQGEADEEKFADAVFDHKTIITYGQKGGFGV